MSEGKTFLEKYIENRMRTKRNVVIAIDGESGLGKSYAGLILADKIDRNKDFDENHIVFYFKEFLDCLDNLKSGCTILFDEAGVEFGHRDFQKWINKILNYLLQTFRFKLINLIFTLPSIAMLDKTGRTLTHIYIHMTKQGEGRVYKQFLNIADGKIWRKKLGTLEFELPRKDLIEIYENKKERVFNERLEKYKEEIRKEKIKQKSLIEILNEAKEKYTKFLDKEGRINAYKIMLELGCSHTRAYAIKNLLEEQLRL